MDPMPSSVPPLRLLDAAANRTAEGLRVVEDYTRFVLDDRHLTTQIKQLRHDLAEACSALLGIDRYPSRDTRHDVGTEIATESEGERVDAMDVCLASLERTKQSLRSLEEYSKIHSPELSNELEAMRYHFYTLEKAIAITDDNLSRFEAVALCVLIDGQKTVDAFSTLVTQLIEAGVGMIQLRDKKLSDRKLIQRIAILTTLAKLLASQQAALTIINDRADLAAVTDVDGVHLGQDDLTVSEARAIVGPQKIIGVSTHDFSQARDAVLDGADYLGAGPTFPSQTKKFRSVPGLEFLQEVADQIALPTFAIGGIDATNLSQVLATGITRVAVSGAIADATSPVDTASELLRVLAAQPT
jgi:thiamine-phosphate pyrophosphorylase